MKALSLIFSALAGGDSIEDAGFLRAGATEAVLGCEVRTPSTFGTFPRSFTWGHALQLDAAGRRLLSRAWEAGAGPGDAPLTIDIHSTICETYGLKKAGGSRFTYTHTRGYHPLLAVASGTGEVLHARLRGGPTNTVRGAARFISETVERVRKAKGTGPLTLRADSGFYSKKVVEACRKRQVRFSITMRLHKKLRERIAALAEEFWTSIPYVFAGAGVAEMTYTPFGKKGTPVRLILRRVPPTPGSQLALFTTYDYQAFITDREGETLTLEADHRRHAEIENTNPGPEVRGGAQPPALGEVWGQCRLALFAGDGPQPGAVGEPIGPPGHPHPHEDRTSGVRRHLRFSAITFSLLLAFPRALK